MAKNLVEMGTFNNPHPLHDLRYVNTVIGMMYDNNGNYRAGFKPEEFYDAILLDTLKYGEENYVHLKYAETINIRKGKKTATFRRWAGMTPTLRPLREGIPPMPDKHAYETLEVGNVFSFGRWSEYSDVVDKEVVSEVISERSQQYGENASQIKELYARKTWLSSPNEFYANFKQGFGDLAFGDNITLDDLRWMTSRMKRMMVKPINGKFNYICSPEWINGLIDDPRVAMYMKIEQTTGKLFTSGEPFDLFDLSFIPTMLDEFAYPDVEYPGVYELSGDKKAIRYYAVNAAAKTVYYLDVREDFVVNTSPNTKVKKSFTGYLADGTAVEDQEIWELPTGKTYNFTTTKTVGESPDQTQVKVLVDEIVSIKKQTFTYATNTETGVMYKQWGTVLDVLDSTNTTNANTDITFIQNAAKAGDLAQVPVHRGILFGDEAMLKINIEGVSDAPRIIIKPLGSAGVNDPLDQRQSIGYRVDGFGLAIKRPEAICVTYGIPTNAEFASFSAAYILGNPVSLFGPTSGENTIYVDGSGYLQDNKVLKTDKPGVNGVAPVVPGSQLDANGSTIKNTSGKVVTGKGLHKNVAEAGKDSNEI